MKVSFKLCPRRHERKQEVVKLSSGLCCNNIMHIKTGVYIVVYFEALQVTAFFTYVFTKIFISCCGIDFFILFLVSLGYIGITFLLYDGAKNGDVYKLRACLVVFLARLILFILWSAMIVVVNVLEWEGFEYFKEYMIARLSFATSSIIYCFGASVVVFKCHTFYARLKVIANRGRATTTLQLPCFQVPDLTQLQGSPYAINANNCCQKHCQILINKGAIIQKSPISIKSDSVNSETP